MEVATVEHGLPAGMAEDMAQYSGAGVSERTQDFALPFMAIAQSNSPQVKKQQPDKYIPGLEAGDIFNTATRKFWKGADGIQVVPVWFEKAWVEWIVREAGGGYVATYGIDSGVEKTARRGGPDKRYLLLPNGHQLVDTSYHFVIDMEGSAVVVPMTSTGLAASRMWQTLMKEVKVRTASGSMVIAPCFSRVYRLRSVYKKNDKGDWFSWTISDEGWSVPEYRGIYELAKNNFIEFRENGVVLGRPPIDDSETHEPVGEEPPI